MNLRTVLEGRIRELFDVDLVQGALYHKGRQNGGQPAGSRAGYINKHNGYRIICIDYVDHFEHNLMWFLTHGKWLPAGYEVDHINRIRHDNRPKNLRKATRSQNCANASLRKDNKTGYRGVYFDKEKKKYGVVVVANKLRYSFGKFEDVREAAKVAAEARKELFGVFAS